MFLEALSLLFVRDQGDDAVDIVLGQRRVFVDRGDVAVLQTHDWALPHLEMQIRGGRINHLNQQIFEVGFHHELGLLRLWGLLGLLR